MRCRSVTCREPNMSSSFVPLNPVQLPLPVFSPASSLDPEPEGFAAMPIYDDPAEGVTVQAPLLGDWTVAILEALGTPADIAGDVAEVVVASDRRGIASHGTARLPSYASLVEGGVLIPSARPILVGARPALAQFDAQNGWGHHAGRVAVDWTIQAARATGTATAIVAHSNHYGIAGWYALRAAEAGLIGLSLTNSSPLVAPTRARGPMIGTNPITIAAPAGRWGTHCLDMATSTIPRGRIEVAARRGQQLEPGWAIDVEGRPATTPEAALAGALQPLGGSESMGGYKGYGLALAVDLVTGVLSGSAFGPSIPGLFSTAGPSDLGQAFLALDPAAIDQSGAFERHLESYFDTLAAAPTIPDAPGRVLAPGEPERDAERRAEVRGVIVDPEHHASLEALGSRFGLPFPAVKPLSAKAEPES